VNISKKCISIIIKHSREYSHPSEKHKDDALAFARVTLLVGETVVLNNESDVVLSATLLT
jgi:hypothetical protein